MSTFVNLTNHPSDRWNKDQMEAARKLAANGLVIDLQFPQVDPEGDETYLRGLARGYAREIAVIQAKAPGPVIVHLMGETGFCAMLTAMLSDDIAVIHSTTRRVVEVNNETGEKKSIFKFVRFRRTARRDNYGTS